jgi:putative ABC transport system permease protein
MKLLLLALRNLTRNKRRTLVTALTIGFGAVAIVFLQSFVNALVRNIVETSIQAKVGAVQVFRAGYLGSDDPLKKSFADDPKLIAKIRAVPRVTAVAPRLDFDGMLSNGSESTMFLATGIDPVREYKVCPKRATYVAKGSRPLGGPGTEGGALIGRALAQALGAKTASTLVMQAAGPHASTNALDVSVLGFLPSSHPAESKRTATVDLRFAQELLRMNGLISEYVVAISDLDRVDGVAGQLRAALGDGYEITTWREMDPNNRDRANMMGRLLLFVALVLFLLVATGIVNTMMMSVHERVREIGTMLAVGVRRRQVMILFLWEAISLGLASAAAGTALGYALVRAIGRNGVTRTFGGGDPMTFYPGVSVGFLAIVIVFAVLGTALAALYPAWKASRLQPVEALRAT